MAADTFHASSEKGLRNAAMIEGYNLDFQM